MSKRTLTLLIALSMAASICSCGKETDHVAETSQKVSESTEDTAHDTLVYKANVPAKTFDGYEFRFLARSEAIGKFWHRDIWAETENGDTLNDAVYARNMAVSEALDISISPFWCDSGNVTSVATASILAGDDEFDAILAPTQQLNSLSLNHNTMDLFTIPYLDLSQPWWDQNSVEDLSVRNQLYYVYGDFTVMDDEATWIIYFNKEIQNDLGLENFYDLVYDGKWTNAKFYELSKAATYDLNGDAAIGVEDMYGYLGEGYNITVSLIGSDALSIRKDENDVPVMLDSTDRFFAAAESALEYMNDPAASLISVRDGITDFERLDKYKRGEALFMMCGAINISVFRDLVADFGLLPIPKLDEAQEGYYTTVSYFNAPGLSVPVTASDPERTGIILETFAAESKNILVPAYYDTVLKRKATRDDESAEMLDIIFEGKRYDIGMLVDAGGIYNRMISLVTTKSSNVASTFASLQSAMETRLGELFNE